MCSSVSGGRRGSDVVVWVKVGTRSFRSRKVFRLDRLRQIPQSLALSSAHESVRCPDIASGWPHRGLVVRYHPTTHQQRGFRTVP